MYQKGTTSIYCCEQYQEQRWKLGERKDWAGRKTHKTYEVSDSIAAPDPAQFFAVSTNKLTAIKYLY